MATPALSCYVLWDLDAAAVGAGLIAGVDSTFEGDWNWVAGASTSLGVYTANPYSGDRSLLATFTGFTGTMSLTLAGLPVTAGRLYLLWQHALALTTGRVVQATVTWRNIFAAQISVFSATTSDAVGSWTPGLLGAVMTAPAGAVTADLTVSWLGCVFGEQHALDSPTLDQLGTDETGRLLSAATSRGRSDELDTIQASTATLVLGNRDGKLTPGAASPGSPYTGNVVPRRRVVLTATDGASKIWPLWVGYTTGYAQTIAKSWSEVSTSCTDAFRVLTGEDVPPPYRAEVLLLDTPDGYLPLDEPQGSATAGSLAGGQLAVILNSAEGWGGSDFGADPVLPVTKAGRTADDNATSLNLNPTATNGGPTDVLEVSAIPGALPTSGGPWTFEFWANFGTTPPAASGIIYRSGYARNNTALTGFQIELYPSGALRVVTAAEGAVISGSYNVCSGTGISVAVDYDPTNGFYGTVRLRYAGVESLSYTLTQSPFSFGLQPDVAYIGAAWQAITRNATFPFVGRIANLAFYTNLVNDNRIAAHISVATGGTPETEGNRFGGILKLVGWPSADTRVDHGYTVLAPRAWSQTNALALAQSVAAQGSAVALVDAAGKVAMQNRRRRINAASVFTFRQSTGTAAEEDYAPTFDDSRLVNVVDASRDQGAAVQVVDTASIGRYGRKRTPQALTYAIRDDEEVTSAATWYLLRYSTPDVRVAEVSWQPIAAPAVLSQQLFAVEIGDKITLADLPSLAPASSVDYFVERIAHSWAKHQWTVTFGLSPVSTVPGVHTALQLDDSTRGRLDSGNALTY